MADAKLQQNVEDQLTRLLTQLQDCEDLKADLDPEEVSGFGPRRCRCRDDSDPVLCALSVHAPALAVRTD